MKEYGKTIARLMTVVMTLMLFPVSTSAEINLPQDFSSQEAMIHNHKIVYVPLAARQTNEGFIVSPQHKDYRDAAEADKLSEKHLRRLYKGLTWCSAILEGAQAVTQTVYSVSDITKTLIAYKNLYHDFAKMILRQKTVLKSDKEIYDASAETVADMEKELNHFKNICTNLLQAAGIVTGVTEFSTEQVAQMLEEYNESCRNIRRIVHAGYNRLWLYYILRNGYWNANLNYTVRPLGNILSSSIQVWKNNAIKVMQETQVAGSGSTSISGGYSSGYSYSDFDKKVDKAIDDVRNTPARN